MRFGVAAAHSSTVSHPDGPHRRRRKPSAQRGRLASAARGGVLVALAEKFGLPVHVIGVGEGAEDFRPFAAKDFARALVGLEQN